MDLATSFLTLKLTYRWLVLLSKLEAAAKSFKPKLLEVLEAMFLLLEALEVAGLAWDLLK
jgi:hypothetical protein